jgi:hypothetical protein
MHEGLLGRCGPELWAQPLPNALDVRAGRPTGVQRYFDIVVLCEVLQPSRTSVSETLSPAFCNRSRMVTGFSDLLREA